MCAVYRTECIGYVDAVCTGQICQCLCKCRIVLGLTIVIAQILQQQNLTRLQSSSLCLCILAYNVLCQNNIFTQQFAQALCNRCHRQLRLPLALRLAHMGACDNGSIMLQQILDGRQSRTNALVVRNYTASVLCHRDVKIAAQQNLLACYVDVSDILLIVVHDNTPYFNWNNVR